MTAIFYVGTYPPIMCGIATYTRSVTRESPPGKWGVLSFDLQRYGSPLTDPNEVAGDPVWYGIPSSEEVSAEIILAGLKHLGARVTRSVLWFQHETAIWRDQKRFVEALRELHVPRILTFHTLHFQSRETPSGLRQYQYDLLEAVLPNADAITVFTYGVYCAVISAFPEFCHKISVINHGVRPCPDVGNLSRMEARRRLWKFLRQRSELDTETKEALEAACVFANPEIVILGQTGFLCPLKQSELLFYVRDRLQHVMPERNVIALRIGCPREASHGIYADQLRRQVDSRTRFLLDVWLPEAVLPLAQRAFDLNFYWPDSCTQSGVLSHALGAGAVIAGRDLEGVGETLKQVGMLVDTDLEGLIRKMRDALLQPERVEEMSLRGLRYRDEFSWENQARRHHDLAEVVIQASMPLRSDWPASELSGWPIASGKKLDFEASAGRN